MYISYVPKACLFTAVFSQLSSDWWTSSIPDGGCRNHVGVGHFSCYKLLLKHESLTIETPEENMQLPTVPLETLVFEQRTYLHSSIFSFNLKPWMDLFFFKVKAILKFKYCKICMAFSLGELWLRKGSDGTCKGLQIIPSLLVGSLMPSSHAPPSKKCSRQ